AKLAKRLNQPLRQDATRDHVIVLVHGIRTFANWQLQIKVVLEKAGLKVWPTNFNWFDLISFLAPLNYFRRKKINEIYEQLREAQRDYPGAKISILAHSFGSYIVAEILADKSDIIVHRLVFCGSIVPSNHRFVKLLGDRIKTEVINDFG